MKKTIIHVGLHKTATTFLQENVWPTIRGYTYLSRPYTQHNSAFNQLQYADETLYKKDLVLKELEHIKANHLLISDESFSGKPEYFSYLNRTIIAKRLKELFPEAEIILFLRDQKDILLSHYNSYIKMPYGIKTIDNFLYKPSRNYHYSDYQKYPDQYDIKSLYYNTNDYFIHLDCFIYSPLVELYNNLFEKCHVFLYEDLRTYRSETISKLEEIVEEPVQIQSLSPKNKSLSYLELERRRKVNRFSCFTNNRYLRKTAQVVSKFSTASNNRNFKTIVNDIADGYYSEDNSVLKKLLPYLGWENHPEKYT